MSNKVALKKTTSSRKKILFCEAGAYGGSVKRLINLLNLIDQTLFSPSVLTYFNISKAKKLLNFSNKIYTKTLGLTSFPAKNVLFKIGFFILPSFFGLQYFVLAVKTIIKVRPDVVYLNNTPFCHLPMILAAKLFRKKLICHMRDSILLSRSEMLAVNLIHHFVVLSESHKNFYIKQKIPSHKIVVIYNGIDLPQFAKSSKQHISFQFEQDQMIAFIGILSERKRQKDALIALSLLVDNFPRLKLIFIGDGPDKDLLHTVVEDLGLQSNVLFLGMVPNVAPYLKACKVGLMISDREGMPNVILEYMAAELPVIATDLPGVNEMVQNNITGHIVPIGDVESISSCLRSILVSPETRMRMGAAGKEILESGNFSVKKEIRDIEHLLRHA